MYSHLPIHLTDIKNWTCQKTYSHTCIHYEVIDAIIKMWTELKSVFTKH